MATKPTVLPRWATDLTNNDPPSAGQQNTGWTVGQVGISDYDNWYKQVNYTWAQYLDDGILDGKFGVRGVISPAVANTQNDWNPTGLATATTIRMVPTGGASPWTITGIAGGEAGRMLLLVNTVGTVITLAHDNTGSATPGNRILCQGDVDLPMGLNAAALLHYDAVTSRWRVVWTSGCHGDEYVFSNWQSVDTAAGQPEFGVAGTVLMSTNSQVYAVCVVPPGCRVKDVTFYSQGDGSTDFTAYLCRGYRDGTAQDDLDNVVVTNASGSWVQRTLTVPGSPVSALSENQFIFVRIELNSSVTSLYFKPPRFRFDKPR